MILAGCGSGGSDGQAADHAGADVSLSAQPTTASSAPADPEAADKAKVLEAYRGMTQAEAEAYRMGSEKGTGLERYATLDALGQTRLDLARMKEPLPRRLR